jgi:ATP-dependent DNA helicase RecG
VITSANVIERLLELGEGPNLEFKTKADTKAITRNVAAFLNAAGGTIVIGVTDGGKAVGIPNAEGLKTQIEHLIGAYITPAASCSVDVELLNGEPCLVIDVPTGSQQPYLYGDEIFVRRGAQTVRASREELSELFNRSRLTSDRWERLPALGYGPSDLDAAQIELTLQSVKRLAMASGEIPLLESLNLTQNNVLLNSSVVLFAKNPARRYPQTRIRLAAFLNDNHHEASDMQVVEGNLFAQVEAVAEFFARHLKVRSKVTTESWTRQDQPEYPAFVLREALMNALTHRDYAAFDGSISVALYPARLEIWNPGRLPDGLTLQELRAGSVSRPRNPDIAHVLYVRGLIERWGIGARRMIEECRANKLPDPEWQEVAGGIRLTLRLPEHGARPVSDLNLRARDFLANLIPGTRFSLADYHQGIASQVTERTARRDIYEMLQLQMIEEIGRGRNLIYIRTSVPIR